MIVNKRNAKCYVGQTTGRLAARWCRHQTRRKDGGCRKIYRAVQKYGPEAFIVAELGQYATQVDLDAAETYWIVYYDCIPNGYNIKEGGSSGKHSLETREKISKANKISCAKFKGQKMPEHVRLKLIATKNRVKYPVSAETRAKISASKKGRRRPPEMLRKRSEAMRGKPVNAALFEANTKRRVAVRDQYGNIYPSILAAAQQLGLHFAAIQRVVVGKQRQTAGWVFTKSL